MRTGLSKYDDVLPETEHADVRWLRDLFEKATVRSLTIQVTIEPVHWITFQHAWLVATQIEYVNQNVLNLFK